ncbi:MAG: HmuY family protein [Myxococcota bacterium]
MIVWTAIALMGCAEDLTFDDEEVVSGDTGLGEDVVEEDEDGARTVRIDGTDYETWVYFDLETGDIVLEGDATWDATWDVAIQRFNVKLNGGVSGDGGVEAATVEDVAFDDLTVAPASGYITDEPDADEDGAPEYALGGWYDYDPNTHVLTPFDIVYVVRSVEVNHHRFQILDYYNDAGTSGHLQFRWANIDSPENEGQ